MSQWAVWGGCPETGMHAYPIWTPLRTAASLANSRSRNCKVPIPVLVKRTPRTPRSDASNIGGGPVTGKVENNQESAERKPQPEITRSPYGKENLQ